MFTGIITAMGSVEKIDTERPDVRYSISTPWDMSEFKIGASICCSGCCLTVVEKGDNNFSVDISRETLSKTNLGDWTLGSKINLEASLKIGDEIGGHMVSGHVDGLATIESIIEDGGSRCIRLKISEDLKKFIAPKGSVALDGVSLTVNGVDDNIFGINIIPHTWKVTTFGDIKIGDTMNMEVDVLARYAARILGK